MVLVANATLTQRAFLSFSSSALLSLARFLVGFVVTPIVVSGLGLHLYGVWGILQQTVGYLALGDLRPVGTLRFSLAIRQHLPDVSEKRRQIGAAVLLWVGTLPVFFSVAAVALYLAPKFIDVDRDQISELRWALGVILTAVAIERIFSLPESVLRGMNSDYKAMGLSALSVLAGGAITAWLVLAGHGIVGMALASLLSVSLAGTVRYVVVHRVLDWFGIEWPSRDEFGTFSRLSVWLFLSAIGSLLLLATDMMVIGILFGPTRAGIYATTGLALRFVGQPLNLFLTSGNAGLVGLCGKGDWQRVAELRSEMIELATFLNIVLGVGVVVLNRSFLQLWMGGDFYGGDLLNALVVTSSLVVTLFRIDSVIVDSILEYRRKAIGQFYAGLIGMLIAFALASRFGIEGCVLGFLCGVITITIYQAILIKRHPLGRAQLRPYAGVRALGVGLLLLMVAFLWGDNVVVQTWGAFLWWGFALVACTAIVMFLFGLSQETRSRLLARILHLVR